MVQMHQPMRQVRACGNILLTVPVVLMKYRYMTKEHNTPRQATMTESTQSQPSTRQPIEGEGDKTRRRENVNPLTYVSQSTTEPERRTERGRETSVADNRNQSTIEKSASNGFRLHVESRKQGTDRQNRL